MSKLKVIKQAFDYFINTDGASTDFHTVMPLAKYFARALWDCFDEKIYRKIAIKPLDQYDFWTKSKSVLITLFDQDESFANELKQKYVDAKERLASEKALALVNGKYSQKYDELVTNEMQKGERSVDISYVDDVAKEAERWKKQKDIAYNTLDAISEDNFWRYSQALDEYNYAESQFNKFDSLNKSFQKNIREIRKLDKDGNVDTRESYDGPVVIFADTLLTPSTFADDERFQIDELNFNPKFLERFKEIVNSKGYQYDNIEVVARQIVIEIANARTMAELFPTEEQENIFNKRKTSPQAPQNYNYQQQSIFDESEL